MMFEYLKQFVDNPIANATAAMNSFHSIKPGSIVEAEKSLGINFPSELRQFYLEIGYGFLIAPIDATKDYDFCNVNRIIPPVDITQIMQNEGGDFMNPDSFSDLSPGDIPVFEIGDGSSFMIMKPLSDNPNAVWYAGIEKIEDSFSQFIYNLYHIGPAYYAETWADEYLASLKE